MLERREVDLAQRPLVDLRGDAHTVGLLVVDGEVLGAGADPLSLQAGDVGRSQPAGEMRVLGEVFEVSAPER